MKTKKRKASPSVLIVLIVAILLIVSVTLAAIFRSSIDITRTFSVTNLKAQSVVTFDGVSARDMEQYTTEYGVLASVDPFADNFIGNLRASVQYSGRGVGLVRVRMVEEWSVPIYDENQAVTGRTVQPYQVEIPYTLATAYTASNGNNQAAWYDNRLNDYCYYFAAPVYSTGTSTVDFITGVDTSQIDLGALPRSTVLHIMVEADVVQANRYPQYWNLDRLPWTGANSARTNIGVEPASDVALPTEAQQQTP